MSRLKTTLPGRQNIARPGVAADFQIQSALENRLNQAVKTLQINQLHKEVKNNQAISPT
jgi:hypothetical protein